MNRWGYRVERGAGGGFIPNWGPQAGWVPGAGLQHRSGWGNIGGEENGQRMYTEDEYKSWNIDRQQGSHQGILNDRRFMHPRAVADLGQEQNISNCRSADMLKTLDRLQTSMNQFENSELQRNQNRRQRRDKVAPKRLQDMSHQSNLGKGKIFDSLKAAGQSIKATFQEQVVKVKNVVKLKPKEKRKSLSEILADEGVEVGLLLYPYLIDASEIERVHKEEEENLEEDLMLWEEGWGGEFRLKTVGEEEDDDLKSPNWEDIKKVRELILSLKSFLTECLPQATTDKARNKIARTKFSNPVNSDPGNCLTFHGFKNGSKATLGSFTISKGHRIPLAGVKRKVIDSSDNLPPLKMVKLEDFNQVMQSKSADCLIQSQVDGLAKSESLKNKNINNLHISEEMVKEFLDNLNRIRQAFQENDNFLQYYSDKQVFVCSFIKFLTP